MTQKTQNERLLRSTLAVSAPTVISRIFGYLRDMLQAKFMGTGMGMDAFTIAFLIPNLLRRLTGEGAMTAAFVPVFTQLKRDETKEKLWKFANTFFFDLTLIMALVTVLGVVFAPLLVRIIGWGFGAETGDLTVLLTRLMFPYIFLVSLAALIMAILNSFHRFFVPALTPVLFNLAIILIAVVFARNTSEPAYVFAAGVLVGGLLQLGFQIPFVWRRGMRFQLLISFRHPAVRRVGRLMVPGIFGAGIYQINMAISRMIASSLEEGSVSSLYYASRVEELTLGIFAIALSVALLPTLSDLAARKDAEGMKRTLNFSMRAIAFITFPAAIGLVILNRPIIQVLFERGAFDASSTDMTASCLFYFAFGIPFISGVKMLAPAFYSLKDTKTPVIVAFFVTFIYIGCSVWLMDSLRVAGIALALSISSLINYGSLFLLLERKIGRLRDRETLLSCLKSLLFAMLMGVGIWTFFGLFAFSEQPFIHRLLILAVTIVLGVLSYLGLNLLFSRRELRSLRRVFIKDSEGQGKERP
jgi:putative peptidoglycan lipid II flippase